MPHVLRYQDDIHTRDHQTRLRVYLRYQNFARIAGSNRGLPILASTLNLRHTSTMIFRKLTHVSDDGLVDSSSVHMRMDCLFQTAQSQTIFFLVSFIFSSHAMETRSGNSRHVQNIGFSISILLPLPSPVDSSREAAQQLLISSRCQRASERYTKRHVRFSRSPALVSVS